MPLVLDRLTGSDGRASIKGLGSLVGEVSTWQLTRSESGLYDLRAVFAFVVPALLLDPDYSEDRFLELSVSRGRKVRVRLDNPERMALRGKVLFMEGISFEWL